MCEWGRGWGWWGLGVGHIGGVYSGMNGGGDVGGVYSGMYALKVGVADLSMEGGRGRYNLEREGHNMDASQMSPPFSA